MPAGGAAGVGAGGGGGEHHLPGGRQEQQVSQGTWPHGQQVLCIYIYIVVIFVNNGIG